MANNDDVKLQKDRFFARFLNLISGVDGHSYNTEKLREIGIRYGKACGAGAVVGGGVAAIPTGGIGVPAGAAIGCAAGVGISIVQNIGTDTVVETLDKFMREIKNGE